MFCPSLSQEPDMQLTYLFDPLCGWCYGAHPMIENIADTSALTLVLAPVGLFAGAQARPMDARFAAYAWQNDQRIARLTGQHFSEAYRTNVLGATGTLFDSAPATLGLVAAAIEAPSQERAVLKAMQHARYVDGRQTSDIAVIAEVLTEADLPAAARQVERRDARLMDAYRNRVGAARADMARFGAQGVPALIAGEGADRRLVPSDILFDRGRDQQAILAAVA